MTIQFRCFLFNLNIPTTYSILLYRYLVLSVSLNIIINIITYILKWKKVTNANIFSHLLISFSLHYDVIVYITWKDDQTLEEDSIVLHNLCIFFVACPILLLVCPWLVVASTRLRKKNRTSSDRPFRSSLSPADSLKMWFQVVVCKNNEKKT